MKKIVEYFSRISETLETSSKLYSSMNNNTNIGSAREMLISKYLRNVLPSFLTFNSGEVFDSHDEMSGQIDIAVSPITSPKLFLTDNIALFPAESVLNAIEVKSVLTTSLTEGDELSKVLKSCKKLKLLKRENHGLMSQVFDPLKVPFSVFAYKGPKITTIKTKLDNFKCTPQELPDAIAVLDPGYFLSKNQNRHSMNKHNECYNEITNKELVLFSYFKYLTEINNEFLRDFKFFEVPIGNYESTFKSNLKNIIDK